MNFCTIHRQNYFMYCVYCGVPQFRYATGTSKAEKNNCGCYECFDGDFMGMIICPECGNKRCPKATNHVNACTNSNEPEQEGSRYSSAYREGENSE